MRKATSSFIKHLLLADDAEGQTTLGQLRSRIKDRFGLDSLENSSSFIAIEPPITIVVQGENFILNKLPHVLCVIASLMTMLLFEVQPVFQTSS